MTISQSGVIRNAPLAMRLRANSVWAMLEFVFNGMVFIMLGLQLPGILETSILQAELDPTIQTWYLFADVATIYAALLVLRFTWLWVMKKASNRFMKSARCGLATTARVSCGWRRSPGCAGRLPWPVCCRYRCC